MRIFQISGEMTCALFDHTLLDLTKQADEQPHYIDCFYPKAKNNSGFISINLLGSKLKNHALCLQKPTEQNQVNLARTVKSQPFSIITRTALAQTKKKQSQLPRVC